jgi:uncharacterized ion transporter superfamily protein YfcC
MKTIFAILIFGIIFLAIVVMVVINFTYRSVRKIKEEVEESYYRNQKRKEMKEKNPFGDDYFKSAGPTKSNTRQRTKAKATTSSERQEPEKEKTARSTTTTGSGVTIIDDRNVEEKRKIFDHSDGEYVEFEEV